MDFTFRSSMTLRHSSQNNPIEVLDWVNGLMSIVHTFFTIELLTFY